MRDKLERFITSQTEQKNPNLIFGLIVLFSLTIIIMLVIIKTGVL